MQKIVNFTKQYIGVISIVLAVCILLTYTFSSFIVSTGKKKVAEMYIGQLKYSMTIEGNNTNTLTVPAGETIVDIGIANLNATNTYYKLLYEKNSNIEISYYESTKDTDEVVTNYGAGGDLINASASTTLKIKIKNSSTDDQTLTFKVSGGYGTNALTDVEVPSEYSEIATIESTKPNTYFCKTTDTLTQGRSYVNGQYTYSYKQQGAITEDGEPNLQNISKDGWGVILTDKTSTDEVTSNLCTYVNNKPTISLSYMFYNSNTTSITGINKFNTSNIVNMAGMFETTKATKIDVSSFDTSNVINMYCMFNKSQAQSLDVSNFNTSRVTNMAGMFLDSKATEIKGLGNFDTSNVKDMSYMFYSSAAATLTLTSFDTSKVTSMRAMFYNAAATEIKGLGNFDTSKVTSMRSMFYSSAAATLTLTSFNTSNVTDMGTMFCMAAATEIKGLENFNTSNVTNMRYMFSNTKVTSLDLSNFDTSNVTSMAGMFENSKFQSLDVSNFDTSKVTNMESMFRKTSVTKIKGLENFNTSKVTNMESMFQESKATSLDLSSFDTSNVTNMTQTFYVCSNLTKIYVSDKFVTDNVTSSSNMFNYSTKLVGGAGTKFNSSYVDKTYARIDKSGTPGYFTAK